MTSILQWLAMGQQRMVIVKKIHGIDSHEDAIAYTTKFIEDWSSEEGMGEEEKSMLWVFSVCAYTISVCARDAGNSTESTAAGLFLLLKSIYQLGRANE